MKSFPARGRIFFWAAKTLRHEDAQRKNNRRGAETRRIKLCVFALNDKKGAKH
jgi:hypothetical protein